MTQDELEDLKEIKLDISHDELEDLIYGLKTTLSKLECNDRIQLIINMNKGLIETYVEPRGDYKFEVKF